MRRGGEFVTSILSKLIVGIATRRSKVTTCNMYINEMEGLV